MNDVVQNGIIIAAVVLAILLLFRRRPPVDLDLILGGLYSINHHDGTFGVAKVLMQDADTVHLRLYRNRFATRPEIVDPAALVLGAPNDGELGFGIGHLPIARRDFAGWSPVLLTQQAVSEDELEGYRIWKEAGGGVFGGLP